VKRELRLWFYIILWLCMGVRKDVYAVLMLWWIEIICLNQRAEYVRLEYTKTNVVY